MATSASILLGSCRETLRENSEDTHCAIMSFVESYHHCECIDCANEINRLKQENDALKHLVQMLQQELQKKDK